MHLSLEPIGIITKVANKSEILYPLQIEWKSLNFHSLSFFL